MKLYKLDEEIYLIGDYTPPAISENARDIIKRMVHNHEFWKKTCKDLKKMYDKEPSHYTVYTTIGSTQELVDMPDLGGPSVPGKEGLPDKPDIVPRLGVIHRVNSRKTAILNEALAINCPWALEIKEKTE